MGPLGEVEPADRDEYVRKGDYPHLPAIAHTVTQASPPPCSLQSATQSSQPAGSIGFNRPNTSEVPTTSLEATLPSAPTRTAEGVPLAPNARPTSKPESITTGDDNPCSRFRSTSPEETTSRLGAFSGRSDSQALRLGSIRWQKPQPGFQKRTAVGCPRKSASA